MGNFLDNPISVQIDAVPCTNRCRHCLSCEYPEKYEMLTTNEIKTILDQLNKLKESSTMQNKMFVYYRAELFLHLEFLNLAEMLYNSGFDTYLKNISTNGYLISNTMNYKDSLLKLKDMGLHTLRFSLYGLKNTHDWFAGREGAFRDIINASIRSREVGLKVQWTVFAHSKNIKEIKDIIQLSKKYVTDEIKNISIADYLGRAIANNELRPTSKEINELPSELMEMVDPEMKSESEWMKVAKDNEFPEKIAKKVFYTISIEKSGNVRDITVPYFGFNAPLIGNFKTDNIQDILKIYKSENSKTVQKWLDFTDINLAEEFGEYDNLQLYNATSIRLKWFRKYLMSTI